MPPKSLSPAVDRFLGVVRRRIARPLWHGLRRPVILRRIERASEARLLGVRLRTEPGVFHPVYFSSSRVLGEHLLTLPLAARRVLEMGTGSGALAIAAAARGAMVTACDVNPRAVALSRVNATLNDVEIEVHESDLFAARALDGRQYDLIFFNIPFYPHAPRTHFEHAFRAGEGFETVRRFAREAAAHLAEEGRVVIVFSEDCERGATLGAFADAGLTLVEERRTTRACEQFSVATFARGRR